MKNKVQTALPDGWQMVSLGEVCENRRGSFPQPYGLKKWYGGDGAMPFVQVVDIDENLTLKPQTKQTISKLAQPKSVFVPKNTIILSIQGSIGRVALTQYDCYVDRTIAIFTKLKPQINLHFFIYVLDKIFKEKAKSARGSTIKTITKEEFNDFKFEIPTLQEQNKIARILSTWDKAINTLDKLIAAKVRFKKGLMQGLLTPHAPLRFAEFKDEWQEVRLGDILKEKTARNSQNSVNLVLSVTNKQGFVAQKDYFEQEVASNDTSNYKIVRNGEFAYNPARINVGSIAMLDNFEAGILSPMYVVFECLGKVNNLFFNQWLQSHHFTGNLYKHLSGSVRETLSFSDMKQMKIHLPTLQEQNKIAQVLTTCDKELGLLRAKLNGFKKQKKALMQRLLSGEIRVK